MGRADLATLVRICDPAGRPYGTGFVADDLGTVVTGHDVVHGLPRPVVRPLDGGGPAIEADSVTPLPGSGLALLHTSGLGVVPLPIGARERVEPGTYVRLVAGGWREARVLATTHGVLELAIGTDGSDALRLVGGATGGPVLDAATGAVLGVLAAPPPPGTATSGVLAHPLGTARSEPHAELLRRNAATAPAYGPDLNLAAVLELTATSLAQAAAPDAWPEPVPRPDIAEEFAAFTANDGAALVLGLAGAPGTGRTTELRALAARRAQGSRPAPTLWLRGADVRAGDTRLADAVARALR
ncbi:S1 family peptidase, partial [Streptomyces sp. NPDC054847]